MAKITWSLKRQSDNYDATSSVMSFNYLQGRRNYLDSYSGGNLTVTLKNQTNIASYFTFNSVWILSDSDAVGTQYFYCQNVTFNDYPGNTGLSTITVSLVDILGRNGRNVFSKVLTEQSTTDSLADLWRTSPYQIGDANPYYFGSSLAQANTYSGSVLNYFNLIQATERGLVYFYDDQVGIIARTDVSGATTAFSFTRNTASNTEIAYQTINRDKAGLNFMNNVTVSANGLANQTAVNSTSLTTYGNAQQTITTLDYSTTQALNNAQWMSSSQADPEAENISITFLDLGQTQTGLTNFLRSFYSNNLSYGSRIAKIWSLVYRVPGAASDTTISVAIEGVALNATPDKTVIDVYFSPLTYYQFFTLNSTTQGILDTSRLGW